MVNLACNTTQARSLFASTIKPSLIYELMSFCLLCVWLCAGVQLPAWPFVCASVFLGAYALMPYMALWEPKSPQQQLPPPEAELVSQQLVAWRHIVTLARCQQG